MTKIIRAITNRFQNRANDLRNKPGTQLEEKIPDVPNRNFGGGLAIGGIEAGIAVVLEDTVGVPFGGSSDVVGVEAVEGGVKYTVNVNAPTQNMAQARAFIDSSTGFTSYLTDLYDVQDVELTKTRMLRDTYQVELLIKD